MQVARSRTSITPHVAVITAIATMLLPAGASATVIHVSSSSGSSGAGCGTVGAPCRSLTDAATIADDGDVLVVAAGDYAGAAFDAAVELRGAQAGVSGAARGFGLDASRASRVHGTVQLLRGGRVDGLEFTGVAQGPAIRLTPGRSGERLGASAIRNSTFEGIDGGRAISVDANLDALDVSDNALRSTGEWQAPLIAVHGEQLHGARGVVIERNTMSGGGIEAGDTSGLVVRGNRVTAAPSLLMLAQAVGTVVDGNEGLEFAGPAVDIGSGVDAAVIERNTFSDGAAAAIRIGDTRGRGTTRGVRIVGNSLEGFASAVAGAGRTLTGVTIVRGNRLVGLRAAAVTNLADAGSIDARRNWWGSSAGIAASAAIGRSDISEPLRLLAEAPGVLLTGGSGVVAARLVDPAGAVEPSATGFAARFTTSAGTLGAPGVPFVAGLAGTMLTAGSEPAHVTVVVQLDSERRIATLEVVRPAAAPAPAAGEPTVAAAPPRPFATRVRLLRGALAGALSRGVSQFVTTTRPCTIRTTIFISHIAARRLGLRGPRSRSDEPYVAGSVARRVGAGRHVLDVRLHRRARIAIARADRVVAIGVDTQLTDARGTRRLSWQRAMLPADVR